MKIIDVLKRVPDDAEHYDYEQEIVTGVTPHRFDSMIIEGNLPAEKYFNLKAQSFEDASDEAKAARVYFWDNRNIEAPLDNDYEYRDDITVDTHLFKNSVSDIEGAYTFRIVASEQQDVPAWHSEDFGEDKSLEDMADIGITITGEAILRQIWGQGVTDPYSTYRETERTFTITLTFDSYKIQRVPIDGITEETQGSVGVKQPEDMIEDNKQAYDAAAYAQLRCIEQGEDPNLVESKFPEEAPEGEQYGPVHKNGGFITIISYGVLPTIDIPCMINNAFNEENKKF